MVKGVCRTFLKRLNRPTAAAAAVVGDCKKHIHVWEPQEGGRWQVRQEGGGGRKGGGGEREGRVEGERVAQRGEEGCGEEGEDLFIDLSIRTQKPYHNLWGK